MRELLIEERNLVAGGLADIVINGHIDASSYFFFNSFAIQSDADHTTFQDGANSSDHSTISVNVHVQDSAHTSDAQHAAENLIKTLSQIYTAASSLAPSTNISLADGSQITASKLINIIETTKFRITDDIYTNGGVGGADWTNHTDSINYSALLETGYASPNYVNNVGMVGIVLHEISHLTDAGHAVDLSEHRLFNQESRENNVPPQARDFNSSAYWFDNEGFADVSANSIGNSIGIFIEQYREARDEQYGERLGYYGAQEIYDHRI